MAFKTSEFRMASFAQNPNSSNLLKNKLRQFIAGSTGFNASSFGEIKFEQVGRKSTYAPYVTVAASTKPSLLWTLFTEHWRLSTPNIILKIAGEGQRQRDIMWRKVASGAWILTTGSSPFTSSGEFISIAIVSIESVYNKENLFTNRPGGLFPAPYKLDSPYEDGMLDRNHSFFVFVDGDYSDVLKFRHGLISYMGSIPIDVDSTYTGFYTIPIAVNLISDQCHHLVELERMESRVLMFVHESAKETFKILQTVESFGNDKKKIDEFFQTKEENPNSPLADIYSDDEIKSLKALITESTNATPITFSQTGVTTKFSDFLLRHVISEKRYSTRSILRLALAWEKMDLIEDLLSTKQEFIMPEPEFLRSTLLMTLFFNAHEFMQLLHDRGIDVYSCITVKTLSRMYYQAVVQRITPMFQFFDPHFTPTHGDVKLVIHKVQHLMGDLSNNEVQDLYDKYTENLVKPCRSKQQRLSLYIEAEDTTEEDRLVDHPYHDVFIWCVFMGMDEMAKVVWKHGKDHIATALLASVLYSKLAAALDEGMQDKVFITELNTNSRNWEHKAMEVVTSMYRRHNIATTQLLCAKLPSLGGFSCLTLAFSGKMREFMALPPLQKSLDHIWYGKTKLDQPMFKTVIGIFIPFVIPWLGVIADKDRIDEGKRFIPRFSRESSRHTHNGEPTGSTLTHFFRQNTTTSTSHPTWRRRFLKGVDDVYDFYNSPRVTYFTHTICLIAAVGLLSFLLLEVNRNQLRILSAEMQVMLWYMVGLFCDEIRQIGAVENKSHFQKLKTWYKDKWNILDLMMILCYIMGMAILCSDQTNASLWFVGKVFVCSTLGGLYIRVIQTYVTSKYFGPKIYMIGQMIQDTVVFLGLIGVVFFCYGIIIKSLAVDRIPRPHNRTIAQCRLGNVVLNGSECFSFNTVLVQMVNDVLLDPYWQIYGNNLNSVSNPQTTMSGVIRLFCSASYVLFTNILMINLLIAMYSYTFNNIQEHSNTIWSYYRYEIIQEFSSRPFLPSPLVLINHAARLFYWLRGKRYHKSAFKMDITVEQLNYDNEFEHGCLMDISCDEQGINTKTTNFAKELTERQDCLEKKLNEVLRILKKLEKNNGEPSSP